MLKFTADTPPRLRAALRSFSQGIEPHLWGAAVAAGEREDIEIFVAAVAEFRKRLDDLERVVREGLITHPSAA